jgi:O-antigen ligase
MKTAITKEKTDAFFDSKNFMYAVFVLGCIAIFTHQEIIFTALFVLIISAVLIFCTDLNASLFPFLILMCFCIREKKSFDDYKPYIWTLGVLVAALVYHFTVIKSKQHIKYSPKGEYFRSFLATSVAVTLGGVGVISAKEYFSAASILYMIALGFGMLGIYVLFSGHCRPSDKYDFSQRFAKMWCGVIVFLFICVVQWYLMNLSKFLADPGILPFQWRNNACTLLMMAMPFPFYLSVKKHAYLILPLIEMITIVFTGSRGGLLFGGIELIILLIILAVADRKTRIPLLIICIAAAAVIIATIPQWTELMRYTMSRFTSFKENKIRLGLWYRALEDFRSNPFTGRGLGYMGNRDIHKSAAGTLCWYHDSILQVIGSFGILGIGCYGYAIYERIRIFRKNKTLFNIFVFTGYIGLELMGLVNPGIFAPLYFLLATIFFVVIENCNNENNLKELELLKASNLKKTKEVKNNGRNKAKIES